MSSVVFKTNLAESDRFLYLTTNLTYPSSALVQEKGGEGNTREGARLNNSIVAFSNSSHSVK